MKANLYKWKMLVASIMAACFFLPQGTMAQTAIFSNPITGSNITASPYTTGQSVASNISSTGIARGLGLSSSGATDRYNATGWTTNSSLSTSDYFSFPITPANGYHINFSSFVYTGQRSSSGPQSFSFRHSSSSFGTGIGSPNSTGTTISLTNSAYQNITSATEFRLYGWSATQSTGTFSINDFTFNGSVLGTSETALTGFSACTNVAGEAQSFVVNGTGLSPTNATITVAPTANYEVSITSATTGFLGNGSATFSASGGNVSRTVWVRLKANATAGNYNNQNIIISGGGFTTANGIDVSCSGTVVANSTLTRTSANGTDGQTVCLGSGITNITYLVGGSGTGASVSGLPSGVNSSYNAGSKVLTISGTPTVTGTFNYTVTTTGPCENIEANGSISINALATLSLNTDPSTTNQGVCFNSPIYNINYAVGGNATSASATGLPAGLNQNFADGVLSISGTATVTGTFNYTVTTNGPCPASLGGSIVINTLPVATLGINPSTVCIGQPATLSVTNSGGNITQVFSGSASPNQPIPNNSNNSYTYSTINLAAGSATLSASDVVVVTLNINHNDLADLDIFLVDPSGTRAMLLTSDNGGSGNNYTNTVLSTAASNVIGSFGNSTAPFTGTYRPEGTITTAPDRTGAASFGNYNNVVPASALNGAGINGNWTLRVFDDNMNSSGTLVNWSLSITSTGAYTTTFSGPGVITPSTPTGSNASPTASVISPLGVNEYFVTTEDLNGCEVVSSTVVLTVQDNGTIDLSSADGTDAQSVCINTAIENITYTFGGSATGISLTGGSLPDGVTASVNDGVLTISGTPTQSGSFNYTISAIGSPCVNPSLSGNISVGELPVVGSVTGPTGACAYTSTSGNLANYTVPSTDPLSAYTWVVPTGATNVSGQGTNSISFKYPEGYSSGAVEVTVTGTCGTPESRSLNISTTAPVTPAVINGNKNVCPFVGTSTQVTYHVDPVADAITYQWTLPPHVNLVSSSPDMTSITVTFAASFGSSANKQIRVRAISGCGNSDLRIIHLVAQYASTPSPISGPTDACPYMDGETEATYVIPKVTAATSYIWSTPSGALNITHPNGPGENDTIIKVTFAPTFTTSTLSVRAFNECGTSNARTINIIRNAPSTPGLITGPSNGCEFILPGGGTATYSIRKMPSATSYTWVTPPNWTVTHENAAGGINDTLIYVQFPVGFTGGSMSVTATNGCGTSLEPRVRSVNKLNPAAPGTIDVIQTSTCPNREYTYSLAAMPSNATYLEWSIPAGGTLVSGQGTASITVTYPATAINGTVRVQALNNCGSSVFKETNIKLAACPQSFAGLSTTVQSKSATVESLPLSKDFHVSLFPNPTVNESMLKVKSSSKDQVTVRVLDLQGRELKRIVSMPDGIRNVGAGLKPGSYMVEVLQGKNRSVQQLIKL